MITSHTINSSGWVDQYADYLYNFALGRIRDREIAKDLVQDTFLAGLKAQSKFKGQASERTWLISILKRKIIDYYRKINSKKGKAEVHINYRAADENEGDWLEERVADPFIKNAEDKIQNEELGEAIENCIDKLPQKHAEVFRMKTIEGRETEDICNVLQISSSNLWVMMHRARTGLIECLKKNWY